MTTVPFGTVTDTTGDDRWQPLCVRARLSDPIIGLPANPLHLDGPLAWAAVMQARLDSVRIPPMRDDWAPDLVLPLAQWTAPWPDECDPRLRAANPADVWGWATSAARFDVLSHTAVHVRKRPATDALAMFTTAARFHPGAGPLKARNAAVAAEEVREITWHVLGDRDGIERLLCHVTHLGKMVGHGHGRVLRWTVEPSHDRDAWRARWWPALDGEPLSIRSPHWHLSRRLRCSFSRRG